MWPPLGPVGALEGVSNTEGSGGFFERHLLSCPSRPLAGDKAVKSGATGVMEWPAYLDEYEKLVIRMNTPK